MKFNHYKKAFHSERNEINPQKEANMKNSTRKTAIVLIVIAFIISVSGNVLLAQDQHPGSLITAADLSFISTDSRGSTTQILSHAVSMDQETGNLISAADLTFIKAIPKGSKSQVMSQAASVDQETGILITAADLAFIKSNPKASATPDHSFIVKGH